VLDEPGAKGCRDEGGVLGFVGHGQLLLGLEIGLDVVEKGNGQGVAFVDVGEVAVEACFGVFVCEESGVGEFPAEDWETRVRMFQKGEGKGIGVAEGILSQMKMMDRDLEPPCGSET